MRSTLRRRFSALHGPALAATLLLGAAGAAAVEPEVPPGPLAEELASRVAAELADELALRDEQLPRVFEALIPEMERQGEILLGAQGLDPASLEEVRRQLGEAQAETRERLSYVLDADQRAGLEQAQERVQRRLVAELVVGRLTPPLALTEEQRQRLLPIFVDNLEARRQLSQELGNRRGRRGAWEMDQRTGVLEQELERQLETVLTPAQLSRFDELAVEFRERRKTGARTRARR